MVRRLFYNFPVIRNKKIRPEKPEPQLRDSQTEQELEQLASLDKEEEQRLIEEGYKEGIKELAKHEVEEIPKIRDLERMKDRELMRIKNVFPFVFFPDELVIEENKLTFIWSVFFWSKDVRSVLIKDISKISCESGLFFAKITVLDQYFARDSMMIEYLPKKKALEARRLIQGLIVSTRENIDYADVPKHDVIKSAMKLGEADTREAA